MKKGRGVGCVYWDGRRDGGSSSGRVGIGKVRRVTLVGGGKVEFI